MSTAAVMLVKDEADIIEPVIRHLAYHVDQIIVADNGSTDGTRELLGELENELPPPLLILGRDDQVGYYQSAKTTLLAMQALELGHRWVVPCDADEVWYVSADPDRRIADFLAGQSPEVQIVEAELYHHIPTLHDAPSRDLVGADIGAPIPHRDAVIAAYGLTPEPNPLARIGYRNIHRAGLPKVACRLRPDLVIEAGNHGARTEGTALRAGGLCVRHFSWRSEEQYLRKITNGARAYAETDLPQGTGDHWRSHGSPDDPGFEERVRATFRNGFYSEQPELDRDLTYDPAPFRSAPSDQMRLG